MKKTFVLLSFLLIVFSAHSQSRIGDIVYSVLPPSQFISLNPGWLLLDGCSSPGAKKEFLRSKLHTRLGVKSLPDARGMFIRGMNEGRDVSTGDADGNRLVGSTQMDAIKTHSHNFKHPVTGPISSSGGNPGAIEAIGSYSDKATTGELAQETRPRNIAFYVYVRIN